MQVFSVEKLIQVLPSYKNIAFDKKVKEQEILYLITKKVDKNLVNFYVRIKRKAPGGCLF